MNISTNKTTLFACTFLCGAVAKIYDDIVDNYRLHQFSHPILLEVLKGTFMLTLTFTSMFNPLFLAMLWIFNYVSMWVTPLSYELPYDRSLYITSALLFVFINYDKLFEQMNELYSSLFEVGMSGLALICNIIMENELRKLILLPCVPQYIRDICNIDKEVSLYKLVLSFLGAIWFGFILINQTNMTTKLFVVWDIGYLIIRVCVQIYSLFVYKPKSFPLDETQHKHPDIKEDHKKTDESFTKEEQQEEPKEDLEPKEKPEEPTEPKEEPAKTAETI